MNTIEDASQQVVTLRRTLNELSDFLNSKKELAIHDGNVFNQHFSRVMTLFSDINVSVSRLGREVSRMKELEQELQESDWFRKKSKPTQRIKDLQKETLECMANNQSDLRSLYNQSKIFLDDFAGLISFILGMEAAGIKVCTRSGGFSFGTLYFSLLNYKGDDQMMLMFRDHCLNRLKAAQVFISDYRNQYVQHLSTESNKETIWTLHDMRGDFRFLGKRPSLPPKEIVFVVKGLVECSKKFVVDHL